MHDEVGTCGVAAARFLLTEEGRQQLEQLRNGLFLISGFVFAAALNK